MSNVFSSRLARTLEEVVNIVSTLDLSFVQNIFEVEKMNLVYEVTHNMYQVACLFYQVACLFDLVVVGRRDIVATGNTSKERDTWKEKCEVVEQKCFAFERDMAELRKKVEVVDSLQEEVKMYDSPSNLDARITELEISLKVEEKLH